MNKLFYLIIVLATLTVQRTIAQSQTIDSTKYIDEFGIRQGYFTYPDGFSLAYKGKIIKGYMCTTEGFIHNNRRIGTWICNDFDGNLLGYRIYDNDGNYIEVQLMKNRIVTIAKFVFTYISDEESACEVTEVLSFNKRGKLMKRYTAKDGAKY